MISVTRHPKELLMGSQRQVCLIFMCIPKSNKINLRRTYYSINRALFICSIHIYEHRQLCDTLDINWDFLLWLQSLHLSTRQKPESNHWMNKKCEAFQISPPGQWIYIGYTISYLTKRKIFYSCQIPIKIIKN